jgi:hypothetical protein
MREMPRLTPLHIKLAKNAFMTNLKSAKSSTSSYTHIDLFTFLLIGDFYQIWLQMSKYTKHCEKSKNLHFCQYLSFSVWFPVSFKHWRTNTCGSFPQHSKNSKYYIEKNLVLVSMNMNFSSVTNGVVTTYCIIWYITAVHICSGCFMCYINRTFRLHFFKTSE